MKVHALSLCLAESDLTHKTLTCLVFLSSGASSATMLIFILPAAFYLKLVKKEPLRSPQKVGALVFLVVGIIFMMGSMALIITDWIYNPPNSKHH